MATSSDHEADSYRLLPKPSTFVDLEEDHESLLPPKEGFYRDEPNTPRDPAPPLAALQGRRPLAFVRAIVNLLPWVFVMMVLAWLSSALYYQVRTFKTDVKVLQWNGDEKLELHNDTLPGEPTPILVTNGEGDAKWTVSIPSWLEFPLKPDVYSELCESSKNYSLHLDVNKSKVADYSYYHVDRFYMPVTEAEDLGLLPTNPITKWSSKGSSSLGTEDEISDAAGYCKRSLTYNLETPDAGLGNTLSLLWMSYGLAQKENRSFFIDDRNWAYGRYASYFLPPPDPGCLPPPENHKLPCPHHAEHLVVSHATLGHVFGHDFNEEYQNPKAMAVQRQAWIFAMLRAGYEALFHLARSDQALVDARIADIHERVHERDGLEIGVHVRHGDMHPWDPEFDKSYIPVDRYVQAAQQLAEQARNASLAARGADLTDFAPSAIILATDDPLVYAADAFASAIPAQDEIILGRDKILDAGLPKDEPSPWEGGFTSAKLWSLGQSKTAIRSALEPRDFDAAGERVLPSLSTLKLRRRIARAYFMDLAILGNTDRVVCTQTSTACRLLAVMLGWDRAIEQEQWRNVDGLWFWKGIVW